MCNYNLQTWYIRVTSRVAERLKIPVTIIVMYLRQLLSDKNIKLVYSNEPNQIILSCPVNDGSDRTA